MWCETHGCPDMNCGCDIQVLNLTAIGQVLKETRKDLYLPTFSGRKFNFLNPNVEDIKVLDIAHSLSGLCRYLNHTHHPVTVGDHSINMYDFLQACIHIKRWDLMKSFGFDLPGMVDAGLRTDILKCALFHDGAEAYIGEWPKPIKMAFGHIIKPVEERIQKLIWQKIGCTVTVGIEALVGLVDRAIVYAETELSGGMKYDLLPVELTDTEKSLGREIYHSIGKAVFTNRNQKSTYQGFLSRATDIVGWSACQ